MTLFILFIFQGICDFYSVHTTALEFCYSAGLGLSLLLHYTTCWICVIKIPNIFYPIPLGASLQLVASSTYPNLVWRRLQGPQFSQQKSNTKGCIQVIWFWGQICIWTKVLYHRLRLGSSLLELPSIIHSLNLKYCYPLMSLAEAHLLRHPGLCCSTVFPSQTIYIFFKSYENYYIDVLFE